LHIRETDCAPDHIGIELRYAERKFISLKVRQFLDSSGFDEAEPVIEDNYLCVDSPLTRLQQESLRERWSNEGSATDFRPECRTMRAISTRSPAA
jgi:hypothetical protein